MTNDHVMSRACHADYCMGELAVVIGRQSTRCAWLAVTQLAECSENQKCPWRNDTKSLPRCHAQAETVLIRSLTVVRVPGRMAGRVMMPKKISTIFRSGARGRGEEYGVPQIPGEPCLHGRVRVGVRPGQRTKRRAG